MKFNSKNLAETSNEYNIRGDVFSFWHSKMTGKDCENYESRLHSSGKQPALDKCLESLDSSQEYNHLRENFLIEYELCMKKFSSPTVCLDAIAVRRLLIEYRTCCKHNDRVIYSTICSYKDFNSKYLDYNLTSLVNHLANSSSGIRFSYFFILYFVFIPRIVKIARAL